MIKVELNNFHFGSGSPFVLIAGPCVVESESLVLYTAEKLKEITSELKIPLVFKSSYKKANRTSLDSFSTLGIVEALEILAKVKKELDVPILTDIHKEEEAHTVSAVADILQIPAFLCRQTDLLLAAGQTGKIVNIKKGQFLSPGDMKHAVKKVESTGNRKILLTERGSTFGYNNLVVDMRSLKIMSDLGYPVIMDATHSVQIPGGEGVTGGSPEFIEPLARAASAVGIDGLFLEVHPDPERALSDSASQLHLNSVKGLLQVIQKIDSIIKNRF